jgi:microcystin-dependent protein
MPYTVNFTDSENKTPITVFDNTSSTDTSLIFPGRNVTGYGQIIAENFLHLLENFASDTQPVNPVEGQLWYDTINSSLKLYDNVNWTAASGIQKGPSQPDVADSKVGELWVDTTNQQLRIYTGQRWLLVGPNQSTVDGLRYGPSVEKISDSDNIDRYILLFYIADIPVIIFSKDSFTPKVKILGFPYLRSGLNVATDKDLQGNIDPGVAPLFAGGFLPIVFGTARNADALNVGGIEVEAGKFLRSNAINTTEFGFNIRNNSGLTLGVDQTFNISTTATAAKIYNSAFGSSIDVQTNRNGTPTTILRVIDNKVSINKSSPDFELDIDGSIQATGSLIITNTTASTNLNNGSIKTAGGMSITKNLIVGDGINVSSTLQTNNVQPSETNTYDIGTPSNRFRTVRARTVVADTIEGVLAGNISGRANTAIALDEPTVFQLSGDVISGPITFDGQTGGYQKIFQTEFTANIIALKPEPSPNVSRKTDLVLTYRASESSSASSGLLKQTRDTFVADLGVPMGAIMPYAGPNAPYGYLFCDGSEVQIASYPDLYNVIGPTYNGAAPLQGATNTTFRIPDLRGRFALGKDNMGNQINIPLPGSGTTLGGGGLAGRVPDVLAQTLGGAAGQASVGLILSNLPEHSHTLSSDTQDYAAIAVTSTLDANATTGLGPTAPGQAQYLRDSGGIRKGTGVTLGTPVGIMNPFQTLNYIIRSGPPAFTVQQN